MNRLLLRQIDKHLGGLDKAPEEFIKLLEAIGESYDHYEKDRKLIELSTELSSQEMVELNSLLKKEQETLERKNKELEQFAYVASHDLQEPLRTISSFVELFIRQYKEKIDENADKYLDNILQSSTRMRILIMDLLEYSRIGNENKLEEFDCNLVLGEVLADLHAAINETGTEIEIGQLPVITGYMAEVKQLFQNLITNAMKFRKANISPRIKISACHKLNRWQFEFSDNGIGIAKEYHDRIFIIFQRLHTRTQYQGSGIGLSHCKKIVELHNGDIWLISELDKGTTFYFTIPRNIQEEKNKLHIDQC